ncbi:MAG TPA: SMI1/KNR4 family protein [Chthonomonas sp.]|uniref:SMI1/KNR4 family protein n=1 Tax=Chthonomonas sp. TaxID=2282153 RepID=UPI002B4AE419|nr:SMI1/KNR4 family protein [Chthonomonas sp.]HLI47693.1 SMI1/KNR4 family protein [Chthonomonas sp.]
MSRREERRQAATDAALRALERFWQLRLPELFRSLYRQQEQPFLGHCEFFPLDAILAGNGREYGMLPQLLPFGRAVDEGGLYGFYAPRQKTEVDQWPVLYWDEDEMFLRPVASDFGAFLRHCALVGRYELEEQWAEMELYDPEQYQLLAHLGLTHYKDIPCPRNETELHLAIVESDPQAALSLCHLGCRRRANNDDERALDYFHRAAEAAPWFGDPCYLMADVYRERGDLARATEEWWAVLNHLIPLCTRTWEWDLGADHPEADIYEVAADALVQYSRHADARFRSDPLWHVAVFDDPYDPKAREVLGNTYLAQGNFEAAEREFLNALTLAIGEESDQPDRLYDSLIMLYERTGRSREASLARYDRALPPPNA